METLAHIHRYSVEASVQRLYGVVEFDGDASSRVRSAYDSERSVGLESRQFGSLYELSPTEVGGGSQGSPTYPTGEWARCVIPAREMSALRLVKLVRVYFTAPTGTSVFVRPTTTAEAKRWNGAAWETAGDDDYMTPAALQVVLPSNWPFTSLGFEVRIRTTVATSTPRFYGVLVGCEFLYSRTSVDDTRPSSPRDEVLTRTLARLLATGPSYLLCEEFETAESTSTITYDPADREGFDATLNVTSVTAVYNLTDDPNMAAPLSGAWDASTKVFTLDTPIAADKAVRTEFSLGLPCVFSGDPDWFEQVIPFLHLTSLTELDRRELGHDERLVTADGTQVWRIPAPNECTLAMQLRVVADDYSEAQEISQAIARWIERGAGAGGYGRTLLSPATALPVHLKLQGDSGEVERRGEAYQVEMGLVVERWREPNPAGYEPAFTTIELR